MSFSSDQPIHSKEEDKFSRWPFAKRIADTLAERIDPRCLVIGIYGPWGDGKTSTLRLMQSALAEKQNVVTVEFNPWLFGSDEQLLRGFFATLASAIGRSLPTRKEEIGKILERYGSVLSLGGGGIGEAARGLGKALSAVELDDQRKRVEAILHGTGKRVIVLIDDIDRLDRREIQAIFKLVKLSGSFENTAYVLAFDDQIVSAALGENYGEGTQKAGRSFLEKIVQVPLHLPPPDALALRTIVFNGAAEALNLSGITVSTGDAQTFAFRFTQSLEPALRTPRHAKLYSNALVFALPLLKGEVHPVDQMLIEGVRVLYPNLYVAIRDNPEFFLKGRREARDDNLRPRIENCINIALEVDGAVDVELIRQGLLYHLFPRLQAVFGLTHYGPEWNTRWGREQRICSEQYFKRYFTYGIPSSDVSDAEVIQLENGSAGASTLDLLLSGFAARGLIGHAVEKLRRREPDIPLGVIPRLAMAIARNGKLLPRDDLFGGTAMQAGILVANLIKRIGALDEREHLAQVVIETAEPILFAVECLRWIDLPEDKPESERIVPKICERKLGEKIANRIKTHANTMPTYIEFGTDSPQLLWTWSEYGPPGEVSTYLRERFELNSSEVINFLLTYTGLNWESRIARDSYNAVGKLIDPEFVLSKIREHYRCELENSEFGRLDDVPVGKRIACLFADIHKVAKAQAATPAGAVQAAAESAAGQPT